MMPDTSSPSLDGVLAEDKTAVQDVILVMQALKKCTAWNVEVKGTTYEVTGWLGTDKQDKEITMEDLNMIQATNYLRVRAGVRLFGATGKAALCVRVLSHTEPAMLQEFTVERVCKRSRWFSGLLQ